MNIQIYGTHTCSDCKRTKLFLADRNIAYDEFFIEEDENAMQRSLEINGNQTLTPTVVFPDGTFLVEPDNEQLEKKLREVGLL